MKEVKLNIEGMHCTGCSTRLEKVLNNLEQSKIYRTDLNGSIGIKLNKNGYKIRTCNS